MGKKEIKRKRGLKINSGSKWVANCAKRFYQPIQFEAVEAMNLLFKI